eukprot:TRINITY_DN17697_c0_g5_i1.p1 TRINITY_DN17697_c0_g5~~TRINITY_DN17697_c0_g5_i1.p1  ORF type:complete len:696 (-),score=96.72 TRINITY_DN17697_c0_g5_i1:32-2119(-)
MTADSSTPTAPVDLALETFGERTATEIDSDSDTPEIQSQEPSLVLVGSAPPRCTGHSADECSRGSQNTRPNVVAVALEVESVERHIEIEVVEVGEKIVSISPQKGDPQSLGTLLVDSESWLEMPAKPSTSMRGASPVRTHPKGLRQEACPRAFSGTVLQESPSCPETHLDTLSLTSIAQVGPGVIEVDRKTLTRDALTIASSGISLPRQLLWRSSFPHLSSPLHVAAQLSPVHVASLLGSSLASECDFDNVVDAARRTIETVGTLLASPPPTIAPVDMSKIHQEHGTSPSTPVSRDMAPPQMKENNPELPMSALAFNADSLMFNEPRLPLSDVKLLSRPTELLTSSESKETGTPLLEPRSLRASPAVLSKPALAKPLEAQSVLSDTALWQMGRVATSLDRLMFGDSPADADRCAGLLIDELLEDPRSPEPGKCEDLRKDISGIEVDVPPPETSWLQPPPRRPHGQRIAVWFIERVRGEQVSFHHVTDQEEPYLSQALSKALATTPRSCRGAVAAANASNELYTKFQDHLATDLACVAPYRCVPFCSDFARRWPNRLGHPAMSATLLVSVGSSARGGLLAGNALGRVKGAVEELLRSAGIAIFKIGITCNPFMRWQAYERDGYTRFHLVFAAEEVGAVQMLEACLIDFFGERSGCRNIARGGEGPVGRGPYFTYLAVAPCGDGIGVGRRKKRLRRN